MKELDFTQRNVEVLTLEELSQTYKENYPNGLPVGGMYHFVLLNRLVEMLERAGLSPEVEEIFAANNREKYRPGVTISDEVAREKGRNALEAHILRRVYANINLSYPCGEGCTMNLAVAYHQKGIQVAFGPYVHVCHNQTILGSKDLFTTQKMTGLAVHPCYTKDVNELLNQVQAYVDQATERFERMAEMVEDFRSTAFDQTDFERLLTMLMCRRIRKDSHLVNIHTSLPYPLNASQINSAVERYLNMVTEPGTDGRDTTFWDALQCFNYELKGDAAEIPTLLDQTACLTDVFQTVMDVKNGN